MAPFVTRLLLPLAFPVANASGPDTGPLVDIVGLGKVSGSFKVNNLTQGTENVSAFLGVPYAKPPVGDLRWQPPQLHEPWSGIRNAQEYGTICIHGGSKLETEENVRGQGQSEDCLFISIFSPTSALRSRKTLPVMFWVHPGVYIAGSGVADSDYLVANSGFTVVVATINYRLGIFGFLSSSVLKSRATYDGSKSMAHAESTYNSVLDATRCADLECLLHLDSHELQNATSHISVHSPIQDGVSLTDSVLNLMERWEFNTKVPVMLLTCRDEAAGKLVYKPITTDLELDSWINKTIIPSLANQTDVATIRRLYDPARYPYPKDLGNYSIQFWMQDAIYSDRMQSTGSSGRCGMRHVAKDLLNGGSPAVHASVFGHANRGGKYAHPPFAWHGCEVSYVFANAASKDADEVELSHKTASYWSNFAITGDPNAPGLPYWSSFNTTDDPTLVLQTVSEGGISTQMNKAQKEACDWWDTHKMISQSTGPGLKVPHEAVDAMFV